MQLPQSPNEHHDAPSLVDATTLADVLSVAVTHGGPGTGLVDLDGSLQTWAEVHRRANAIATMLRDIGIRAGDRVAVLLPKSAASFVAVHGILAAGGVVVPLDPLGASAALVKILAQSEVGAAVVDPAVAARQVPAALRATTVPLIHTDDSAPLLGLGVEASRLLQFPNPDTSSDLGQNADLPSLDPEDPAYLIFTSGSTGEPKGIVHSHRSGLAYARTAIDHHRLDRTSRVAGIPPLHFDMSTLELYSTPLAGGTAVSISEAEQRFPATLSARLADEGVTHVYAVPFLLRQLQERGALEQRDLTALRHIGYAGEPYAPGAVAELMAAVPEVAVTNLYGPAETNVVTSYELPRPPSSGNDVPIGRLWPGCEARVVSEDGSDAAPGEPGELWVSAPTSMTGYWRQPDLTAERLHPRCDGWPWYATGDVVVLESDPETGDPGLFHYLGRRDNQVKIRGVRLELEPIESVLTDAIGVEHAVAGVVEAIEGNILVAAVVVESGHEFDPRAIRRWCARQLPPAALPSEIVVHETMPMTASGKIDRARVRSAMTSEIHAGS